MDSEDSKNLYLITKVNLELKRSITSYVYKYAISFV